MYDLFFDFMYPKTIQVQIKKHKKKRINKKYAKKYGYKEIPNPEYELAQISKEIIEKTEIGKIFNLIGSFNKY